jgi:hypothetical protein
VAEILFGMWRRWAVGVPNFWAHDGGAPILFGQAPWAAPS